MDIPCWIYFSVGSLSYTSIADFVFMCFYLFYMGSFTYTSRAFFFFFLSGEFLLHIPCWLHFYLWRFSYTSRCGFVFVVVVVVNLGSFSYTSRAGLFFIGRVSLTHPMLVSYLLEEFLLHILCWLHFYLESSPSPPPFFLSGEFLLHIPCWIYFSVSSFSYTSRSAFIFIRGVSLIHHVMV